MKCAHTRTKTIATRCFDGGVSKHNPNRRAHGNICDEEECLECGARRFVNLNAGHSEVGEWGPSAAERHRAEREEERTAARAAAKISPLRIGRAGVYVTVRLNSKGEIVIEGEHTEADRVSAQRWLALAQPDWLAAAKHAGELIVNFRRGIIGHERLHDIQGL